MNEDKCSKFFDCLTDVDEKYIEESSNGKLKSTRPVWLKLCPMVACCLLILITAALIINMKPGINMKSGNNSKYPYNDDKVLDYVGATLDDIPTDDGTIVFNEITDIELYRNFNADYRYEGLLRYYTRFTALSLLEQYSSNQIEPDSLTLYKKDGSFEKCIAYSSFLTFSKHFPREAAFAKKLYDFSNEQPIGINGVPSISAVGFYSQLSNCILSVVISPDLSSIDSRLAEFLPLLRSTLGTENSSTINGHEVSVHYFYQQRSFRGEKTEEAYQYYAYFEADGLQYLYQFSSNWSLPGENVSAVHNPPAVLAYVDSQEYCRKTFINILIPMVNEALADDTTSKP
jgi:hypothetical protein